MDPEALAGQLMTTEGNVIHYGFIEKFIEDRSEKYHIREIAFDRWGATQMTQDLEGMVRHEGEQESVYDSIPEGFCLSDSNSLI